MTHPTMAPAAHDALIVGGGIGGLTAALALARAGRRVHVIEKAPAFGEIGAGLQLAPNAMRRLDALGLVPALLEHAVQPKRLVWMDALEGVPITALDLGAPFLARYRQPYVVMHRGDLLSVLLAACEAEPRITLEPARAVVALEDRGDVAAARLADGTAMTARLLVGCDGLWSTTRKALVDDAPICSAYVAYRGAVPIENLAGRVAQDAVLMWVGPDMHFVQYPVRRGELYNQVAVFKSPRYRPEIAETEEWGTVEEFDAHYSQCCAFVRDCAKLMGREKRWPMFDRAPLRTWTRGRIALMGDAAHAMLQYAAQGACQAIEDAASLGDHVAASPDDLPRALAGYEAARAPHAARVQRVARDIGDYFHLHGAEAAARNALMRKRAEDDYAPLDWLYGNGL